MRRVRQFGQPMLQQRHLTARQPTQQQRSGQRSPRVQLGHERADVGADRRLVHQIDGRPLACELRQANGRLGRDGVACDQVFAHSIAGAGDQPFGDLQRQRLAVGHGGHDFRRAAEPIDDDAQRPLGQVGVVVRGQCSHGGLRALGRQDLGHVARHARTRGHRRLTRGRAGPHDLDQVVVAEGRRKADQRQGDRVDIRRQSPRHVVGNEVRALQRHGHGAPDELSRVLRQNTQYLLRRRPVRRIERNPLHAAAQLMRGLGALVFVLGLDQPADVDIGQAGAKGGHRGLAAGSDGRSIIHPCCLTRGLPCVEDYAASSARGVNAWPKPPPLDPSCPRRRASSP